MQFGRDAYLGGCTIIGATGSSDEADGGFRKGCVASTSRTGLGIYAINFAGRGISLTTSTIIICLQHAVLALQSSVEVAADGMSAEVFIRRASNSNDPEDVDLYLEIKDSF